MSKLFTDENFEQDVLEASKTKPVLVDFFAEWCGPCHVMAPVIDKLADKIGDKAVIGKLNVDEAKKTATKYGVMSIPTLKIFKEGKVVEETVGVQAEKNLIDLLNKYI